MNKKIFSIFLLGILFFGIVSAEIIINPSSGVQYEKEIVDLFDSGQEWADLIVYLNNASDFNDIFSHFSEKDIKRISQGEFSPDFIGLSATKLVFDELVNDSRIKSIYYDESIGYASSKISVSKIGFKWIIFSLILAVILIILIIEYKRGKKSVKK